MERDNQEALPLRMPAETRTIHRVLTPEEDAVVGHLRSYCHNGAVCRLCTVERTMHEQITVLREQRDLARDRVNSIIGGGLTSAERDAVTELLADVEG